MIMYKVKIRPVVCGILISSFDQALAMASTWPYPMSQPRLNTNKDRGHQREREGKKWEHTYTFTENVYIVKCLLGNVSRDDFGLTESSHAKKIDCKNKIESPWIEAWPTDFLRKAFSHFYFGHFFHDFSKLMFWFKVGTTTSYGPKIERNKKKPG